MALVAVNAAAVVALVAIDLVQIDAVIDNQVYFAHH
jgi:hypothetical protein